MKRTEVLTLTGRPFKTWSYGSLSKHESTVHVSLHQESEGEPTFVSVKTGLGGQEAMLTPDEALTLSHALRAAAERFLHRVPESGWLPGSSPRNFNYERFFPPPGQGGADQMPPPDGGS